MHGLVRVCRCILKWFEMVGLTMFGKVGSMTINFIEWAFVFFSFFFIKVK